MQERNNPHSVIYADGNTISELLEVTMLRVKSEVNKLHKASLTLRANCSSQTDAIAELTSSQLQVGRSVLIEVGTDSESTHQLIEGFISQANLKVKSGVPVLKLQVTSNWRICSVAKKRRVFVDKPEKDVFKEVFAEYTDLEFDLDQMTLEHPSLIQDFETDWDFLVRRSQENGCLLVNSSNSLELLNMLEPFETINDFSLENGFYELDFAYVWESSLEGVEGVLWDTAKSENYTYEVDRKEVLSSGDLAIDSFDVSSGSTGKETLYQKGVVTSDVLEKKVDALVGYTSLFKLKGSLKIWGSPEIEVGKTINMEGIGTHYEGEHLVTSVIHEVTNSKWYTKIGVGLEKSELVALQEKSQTRNSTLEIGIVENLEDDPEGLSRVQVRLIGMPEDAEPIWARLNAPYSSGEGGFSFFPEIGSEVVLGFLGDYWNGPVVLGCLFNTDFPASNDASNDNYLKVIKTASGLTLQFDDEKGVIQISTPNENTLTLSDDEQAVSLKDENGNEVLLNSDGISLVSDGEVSVDASGDLLLKSGGNINLEATADFVVSGVNVLQEASASLEVKAPQLAMKGDAMAELSGGIVKIN